MAKGWVAAKIAANTARRNAGEKIGDVQTWHRIPKVTCQDLVEHDRKPRGAKGAAYFKFDGDDVWLAPCTNYATVMLEGEGEEGSDLPVCGSCASNSISEAEHKGEPRPVVKPLR